MTDQKQEPEKVVDKQPKLDKRKRYDQVISHKKARWYQDGNLFDGNGNYVGKF